MRKAPCIIIPKSNGACCWKAPPSASRAARRSRSRRAISGARPAMCRTPCGLDRKARACLTSSARRGRSTRSPDRALGQADAEDKARRYREETRMKITRRDVLAGTAALAVAPAYAPAWAQSNTMTLVVPFPPGGSTDALARMIQAPLQTRLNRVVIVENKSGAAGSIGAAQVAKAAPDGSSLLVTFDSHAVIPTILEKPPVDVERDLVPVLLVGTAPYVIAANADLPYKHFADVIAAAKAKPGSVQYASVGIGTLGDPAITLLGNKAGVDLQHVPYRGGGPAMNDVLGGHVDLIAGSAALITPQLEGGKL